MATNTINLLIKQHVDVLDKQKLTVIYKYLPRKCIDYNENIYNLDKYFVDFKLFNNI